ncbi:hypothetical protein LO762_26180 [Actinocorallia sp. API 0066]|uniref:hypothetical protein n=1 Tax=Actinocorallia sp. API 0066 TaxID=2896846 RepID=UPI001E32270A|nr:hypothetical protein [Actinocorallia sp. API 0066]MCD0452644.1 hypothetical protein [Actinocorallia sp. API 0066]
MNEHHWNDHRGVDDALRERFQVAFQTSLEIFGSAKQRAISRSQRLQADLERKSREARDRLRAQHRADMPVMRQAWSRGWWKSVKDKPEEIAHVVEVAGSWARMGDPAGERTLQELSRKIKDEFGIDLDLSLTDRGDLVEQLGTALAPAPKERDDLDVAKAFARANGEKPETAVKAALIRRELGDEEWWSRAPDEESRGPGLPVGGLGSGEREQGRAGSEFPAVAGAGADDSQGGKLRCLGIRCRMTDPYGSEG